jgi:glycosyltransferase involved in cell wall biosynthesis
MNAGPVVLDARAASPHFPGIGRVVTGLAGALARCPDAPRVMLLHGAEPDRRLLVTGLPGITCRSSPFDIGQHWEVRKRLRRAGARLYHSQYYLMPFAPGVPSVVTCHDLIPLVVPGLFSPARRLAIRLAHALAFRASSIIVAPSRSTRDDVARLFPGHASKVEVVPHGSDFSRPADESRAARVRAQLGVPEHYVLVVGGNKPHKNLGLIVEAWRTIVDRRRDGAALPRLVLAGPRDSRFDQGGPHADELRRAGRLISVGTVPDDALAALYSGATLLVCPSRVEGFGLPVIEAMGCGTPVACGRTPALVEVAGAAAALFDLDDAAALARVVEQLLESPAERETMRQAGLARAAAFTWERAARAMSALYARVLEGRA